MRVPKSKKLSAAARDRQLRELRKMINTQSEDRILCRIAYAMETAVIYTHKATHGWPTLKQTAEDLAGFLRKEITK